MVTALASDNPRVLQAASLGEAWLAVARHILADGVATRCDDLPVREVSLVTLTTDKVAGRPAVPALTVLYGWGYGRAG